MAGLVLENRATFLSQSNWPLWTLR